MSSSSRVTSRRAQQNHNNEDSNNETTTSQRSRRRHTSPFRRRQRQLGLNESHDDETQLFETEYQQQKNNTTTTQQSTTVKSPSPRRFHAPNDDSLLVAAVDEDEAHAVFAAAMAASGMDLHVGQPAVVPSNNNTPVRVNPPPPPPNNPQRRSSHYTPEEQWRSAEEDWQMAAGGNSNMNKHASHGKASKQRSNDPQPPVFKNVQENDNVDEEDDDNDSLFDDLGSLGERSTKSAASGLSRPFLVQRTNSQESSEDDDEAVMMMSINKQPPLPLFPTNNPNRPRYPGRNKNKSSTSSVVRHSDSESTVAISNTRARGNKQQLQQEEVANTASKPAFVPVKKTPPSNKLKQSVVVANNNSNSFQPIAANSPVPVATSARKALQKPSPQKPQLTLSTGNTAVESSTTTTSSRVRMVQEDTNTLPPPQASSSPVVDTSWANFDSAFQQQDEDDHQIQVVVEEESPLSNANQNVGSSVSVAKSSVQTINHITSSSSSLPTISGDGSKDTDQEEKVAKEYETLGVTSSQSHGTSADEQEKYLTELLAKQTISRNDSIGSSSIHITQSKSSQVQSESTYADDDDTDSVSVGTSVYSVSTLGTERTDFSYTARNASNSRKLSAVPEDNAFKCNNEDNPVEWMWSYVEGGITAMNAAFADATSTESKVGASTVSGANNDVSRSVTPATATEEEERVQGYNPKGPSDQTFSSLQPISAASNDAENSLQAWIGYAADLLFPPIANCNNENTISEGQMEVTEDQAAGLVELAQSAARAAHEKEGIEFNEQEVDVCTEVKFSVIRVALPLGILFQENEAGCWVARIFASGNAARAAGDDVQVGDQLASIDGKSAIRKTTEEISVMISGGGVKKDVELTFLRYIGPLRPAPGTAGIPVPEERNYPPRTPSPQKSINQAELSPEAGQEVVVASAREIRKNSSRESATGTFDDQSPAPLLVRETSSRKKFRNPIKRLFSRKKKQFTA